MYVNFYQIVLMDATGIKVQLNQEYPNPPHSHTLYSHDTICLHIPPSSKGWVPVGRGWFSYFCSKAQSSACQRVGMKQIRACQEIMGTDWEEPYCHSEKPQVISLSPARRSGSEFQRQLLPNQQTFKNLTETQSKLSTQTNRNCFIYTYTHHALF